MERWRVRPTVRGRVVWWTVILWACVWGTYIYSGVSRTYILLEESSRGVHACHSYSFPIVPVARGRRRAMGSTSIDGDDDVVDEEDGDRR